MSLQVGSSESSFCFLHIGRSSCIEQVYFQAKNTHTPVSLLQFLIPSFLLLLACISSLLGHATAEACAGGDPVVSSCVFALSAAQALTGNSAQLVVSNAAFSGVCTAGGIESMLLVTSFGCHYLASQMPQGEPDSKTLQTRLCTCVRSSTQTCHEAQALSHSKLLEHTSQACCQEASHRHSAKATQPKPVSSPYSVTHTSQRSSRARQQPQQLLARLQCPADCCLLGFSQRQLLSAGALVMSSGDVRIGATTSNTASQKILQHGNILLGSDPDLQAVSAAAGYSQNLYDQVLLTFDTTPTVSGPLAFQFVWGSESVSDVQPNPR